MLTIFTPTYNRAYRLSKLYQSLQSQTCTDFEWLVVDDGSTDDTSALFSHWMGEENRFSIRYYRQENGGKHRAVNHGVTLAKGDYFFVIDSDDYATPNAVELLSGWAATLFDPSGFAGISGLKAYPDGTIFGGMPRLGPNGYVDATNLERKKFHLGSEKAEAYRTEVLRQFPFPEFEGEKFVTEGIVGNRIAAAGLKLRWFGEPICICEYLEDGLTSLGANQFEGHLRNPKGYLCAMRTKLQYESLKEKIVAIHSYGEVGVALGKTKRQVAADLGAPRLLCGAIDGVYALRRLLSPEYAKRQEEYFHGNTH